MFAAAFPAMGDTSPHNNNNSNNIRMRTLAALTLCIFSVVVVVLVSEAPDAVQETSSSPTTPNDSAQVSPTMTSELSHALREAAIAALVHNNSNRSETAKLKPRQSASTQVVTAKISNAAKNASDVAVQDEVASTLRNLEQHPFASFGKVAEDAAAQTFESSYLHARVRMAMGSEAPDFQDPLDNWKPPHQQEGGYRDTGDIPLPPPLHANGSGTVLWETRLAWAQNGCVNATTTADKTCHELTHGAKELCSIHGGAVCATKLAETEGKCHDEHHYALEVCTALWQSVHKPDAHGVPADPATLLETTRQGRQLSAAHRHCVHEFSQQETECAKAQDTAHEACDALRSKLHRVMNSSSTDDTVELSAYHEVHAGCATATAKATQVCNDGHTRAAAACDRVWQDAHAVASPRLAAAIVEKGGIYMATALDKCLTFRHEVAEACKVKELHAYNACKGADASKCKVAVHEAQTACAAMHTKALQQCRKAYDTAQKSNAALVQHASKVAAKSAAAVASEAKAVGVHRDAAAAAVLETTQDAMAAATHGEAPAPTIVYDNKPLKMARASIRQKMADVVEGVRKVWKAKALSAVKNAASSATVAARQHGASAAAARLAAVKAAKEAAKHLQTLAEEAELTAGARALGPEVESLVTSASEKDRRRFEAMAQPYLQRANALLKTMHQAEAKIEAEHAKKKREMQAKQDAAAAKKQAAQTRELYVKDAAQHVANTTAAVAGAGQDVAKELATIAEEAQEAADTAQGMEDTVSVSSNGV